MLMLGLLLGLLWGGGCQPLTVSVQLGDALLPLTAPSGQHILPTVTAFVDKHQLSTDNVAALVSALEQAYAKQQADLAQAGVVQAEEATAAPAVEGPLFSLPLQLDSKQLEVEYRRGQEPAAVAAAFADAHGLATSSEYNHIVSIITANLARELAAFNAREAEAASRAAAAVELATAQQAAAAADAAASPVSLGPVYIYVDVNLGGDAPVPLELHLGESPRIAATRFVRRYNLEETSVPELMQALLTEMLLAQADNVQFYFPVTVDNRRSYYPFFIGDEPAAVAASIATQAGLNGHAMVGQFTDGMIVELRRTVESFTPPVEIPRESLQAALQAVVAEAAALRPPAAPTTKAASLVVGGASFDLEWPADASMEAAASSFCESEWAVLQPLLGPGDLTKEHCASVVLDVLTAA